MAQLIKLQDYISRYESDIFRYSAQYIRLKKQRWATIKAAYYNDDLEVGETLDEMDDFIPLEAEDWLADEKKSIVSTMKGWIKKKFERKPEDEEDLSFFEPVVERKKSLEELKEEFLDELYNFQLKWASSTLRERSFLNVNTINQKHLLLLLRQFPDNYLVMFHPVFMIGQAPVEGEIVLISPTTIYCIAILEGDSTNVFRAEKGRYWYEVSETIEGKHINPLIALRRMENIVEGILDKEGFLDTMAIKRLVLCPEGYIEYSYIPTKTEFIDARKFEQWLLRQKRNPSPIKYNQLKCAQALLANCQSTYVRRLEWEEDNLQQ